MIEDKNFIKDLECIMSMSNDAMQGGISKNTYIVNLKVMANCLVDKLSKEGLKDDDRRGRNEIKSNILQQQVDTWNQKYSIGQKVVVTLGEGEIESTTRSKAFVLEQHTPVVYVENISGVYSLDMVRAI